MTGASPSATGLLPFGSSLQAVSPVPAAIPSAVLTIPVNGTYFDQIRDGSKLEEYRLVNDYWAKRLERRRIGRVVLTRGYPKGGGVEGVTRLTRLWNGFTPKVITHPHFGPDPVYVYAIDVSAPASGIEAQSDEPLQAAQPVGQEPGGVSRDAQTPDLSPTKGQGL